MGIADLIKRVEGLTDWDREIDTEVLKAFRPGDWARLDDLRINALAKAEAKGLKNRADACWRYAFSGSPAYTASVDAAIALIGEKIPGACWEVGRRAEGIDACVYMDGAWTEAGNAHGATPALALLLAFLRAWEARGDG